MLYFGDHPYSDLADASLMHGWRTGAIIKELSVRRFIARSKALSNQLFVTTIVGDSNDQQHGLQVERELASDSTATHR